MTRFVAVVVLACSFLFAAQAAVAQPKEGEYYQIKNVNSQKVLSLEVGAKEDGAKIVQVAPNQQRELQQWTFVKVGDYYKIINRKTAKALNVEGESQDEGAPIIQWDAEDNSENQQWSLEKKKGHFIIKARHSGLVLDVAEASKERKAPLIQYSFHEGRNQVFELVLVKR